MKRLAGPALLGASLLFPALAAGQSCTNAGQGCPPGLIPPPFCIGQPTLGNANYQIDPGGGGQAFGMAIGLPAAIPLPAPPMCLIPCFLSVTTLIVSAGGAPLPLPIPNNAALVGLKLYAQAVFPSHGPGGTCLLLSQVLEVTLR